MVTGTSVLGIKYCGGVMLAADTLASYGSMARFTEVPRLTQINSRVVLGASGDYADYQYVKDLLDDEQALHDSQMEGHTLSANATYNLLTRYLYKRRSEFNPLWCQMLVAGISCEQRTPFLGYVDKLGTAYESSAIATGYGAYLALPLLREAVDGNPMLTEAEARQVLEDCMRVLFYRDARSIDTVQYATISCERGSAEISAPVKLQSDWQIAGMVRGYQ